MLVEQYGGAASRVGADDTAFAQRHAQYDLGILTQWTDPADSAAPHRVDPRLCRRDGAIPSGDYLLNFLGEESEDIIKAAFGANYARLVEVKTKYDPDNFFRVNQNIQPAAMAAGSIPVAA